MNKRDFYREIMSEFEFDKDKILANAKKGKFAGRSPMPIYIGATAVAAAAIVGVGTFVFTSLGNNRSVDLVTGSTLTALSNKERIERAIEDIRKNENSGELHDMMVTFREPLSPADAQRVLTEKATGSVPVKMLFFSDQSRVVGAEAVGKVFESGEGKITGAVINCAGYLMERLNESSEVLFVEIMTAEDDLNVVAPIDTGDPAIKEFVDPAVDIGGEGTSVPPVGVAPVEPTTPDSSDSENDSSGESNSEDIGDSGDSDTSGEDSGESDGSGSGEDGSNPENPVVPEDVMPEGVKFPENFDGTYYVTEEIGANDAFFMSDDRFFAVTESGLAIYEFDGHEETLIANLECADPRVEWAAEDGSGLLVTAVEGDRRSRLFYVSKDMINELDVGGTVMAGVIENVAYNDKSGTMVLNILEDEVYYVCAMTFDGAEAEYLRVSYYNEAEDVTVLTVDGEYIYMFTEGENGSKIVKAMVNSYCDAIEVYSFSGNAEASPNFGGNYAAVYEDGAAFIFDPIAESLLSVPASGEVEFGASRSSFSCGGGYYTISDGQISAASGISVIEKIDWKRSFSSEYQAKATGGKIRVTSGSYNEDNAQLNIVFGAPEENATAEMREAVDLGVGLQNAIARSKMQASGINDAETLNKVLKAIYTKTGQEALISRCVIVQGGEPTYQKGGLFTMNLADSVLSITSNDGSNAAGVLYVKVGEFDGNAGYRTVNVSLSKAGSKWKLNGIIE